MIVDDTKIFRKILRNMLESLDHEITLEAASGEEALELYDSSIVDCVLMDVEMGGISGIETLKVLKEREPDVKVILVSSVSEAGRLKEAIHGGAICTIQKPTQIEVLRSALEKAICH